ncbi:MAG: cytochrome c biogenesis protein ResB [Elusimicrobia bacterium]|nr:cytochrome c biogenesis protein ResB [Candidatus Obscuribacterium magneticum]
MNKIKKLALLFGSTPLTLFSLGLMMILVVMGTLAQAKVGVFETQKQFFNSVWVWSRPWGPIRIPLFPGGLAVGALWMLNLTASFVSRFQYRKNDFGILITHAGLALLLLGQFLTQMGSRENLLEIREGETKSFLESPRDHELAVFTTFDEHSDQVVSIPDGFFKTNKRLNLPGLSLYFVVREVVPNAELVPERDGWSARPLPVGTGDDASNNLAVKLEALYEKGSLGTRLLSLSMPETTILDTRGQAYQLILRRRRTPLPFSLTLKDFRHDVYPGTDIPKNFSSLIRLEYPANNESRDALIYMNHPLRYQGLAFYQSGYGENSTLSILQVVDNPAWLWPYLSCFLISIGLMIQFTLHLYTFARKRS